MLPVRRGKPAPARAVRSNALNWILTAAIAVLAYGLWDPSIYPWGAGRKDPNWPHMPPTLEDIKAMEDKLANAFKVGPDIEAFIIQTLESERKNAAAAAKRAEETAGLGGGKYLCM